MVATKAGDASWPIRFGDNATPEAGTFEIYLKTAAKNITEEDIEILLVNEVLGDDEGLTVSWGAAKAGWRIKDCKMPISSASGAGGWIEIIKRAKKYWAANDTDLYLTIKDMNAYNQAVVSNVAGSSVSQATVRFLEYKRHDEDAVNAIIDVGLVRTA